MLQQQQLEMRDVSVLQVYHWTTSDGIP